MIDLETAFDALVRASSLADEPLATITPRARLYRRRRRIARNAIIAATSLTLIAVIVVLAAPLDTTATQVQVQMTTTPDDNTSRTTSGDDEPLHIPGYPPGTALTLAGGPNGLIAGYVASHCIRGPESGGPPPAGMPGYPITNEQGNLLYGYEVPLIGAVRRSIAEDPGRLALLKTCVGWRVSVSFVDRPTTPPAPSTTTEPSRDCRAIVREHSEPFGLAIPPDQLLHPSTSQPMRPTRFTLRLKE